VVGTRKTGARTQLEDAGTLLVGICVARLGEMLRPSPSCSPGARSDVRGLVARLDKNEVAPFPRHDVWELPAPVVPKVHWLVCLF